jgi:integrase
MGIYYNRQRKKWIAQVTYHGRRDSRACETKKDAREAEAEILTALKAQTQAEREAEQQPATPRLLCDAYAADLEARGKARDSIARAEDTKKRLEECFGKKWMDEPLRLTEADLWTFRKARLAVRAPEANGTGGVAESTVNRDLRTLRAMLKKARPEFRFPAGLFLKEDETRVRWLEPEQEVLVMANLRSPFQEIARLAALTLMRLSEVARLRREHVMLSQGVIRLPRSKTGPDTVVLNGEALGLLRKQLDAHPSEWVFPGKHGGPYSRVHVSREWREAARAAGLDDFHFHDLRHHGATMALNANFSPAIVMALGRWKTERMMRRYAAVTDKTLRAAAEAVAGNVAGGSATSRPLAQIRA